MNRKYDSTVWNDAYVQINETKLQQAEYKITERKT